MKWTPRIEQAIKRAALLHRAQTRRGAIDYPYITHLISVATILAHYTDDEDVIIAGLLHDTIEDTEYTAEQLETEFGARVKEFVDNVTENNKENGKIRPWRARKEDYLKRLRGAPVESLLIAAADKIHNLRSILENYRLLGEEFWPLYTREKDPERVKENVRERLEFFADALRIFEERALDPGILKEYKSIYEEARKVFT